MSKQTQALKLALEALELSSVTVDSFGVQNKTREAITAIREALAEQPAQQKPVRFKCTVVDDAHPNGVPLSQWGKQHEPGQHEVRTLYTSPQPSKPWVGLTDEEVKHQWEIWRANIPRYAGFAKGIEAKLKEKNA